MTARVADRLGAVHVGVDDVGADLGQVRRQRADGDRVVGLVDDQDVDAGALELADGTPRRERDDRDVVARRVDAGDQRVEVLLGAAVGAGREDLDDADRPPPASVGRVDGLEAGIERARARSSSDRSSHEHALDRLVHRAPLVLVGLVAAQEVEPPLARSRARARRRRGP